MQDSKSIASITYDQFEAVDIRVGQILEVSLIENPKHSTHRLIIDFGPEIGQKISCARLVKYSLEELQGRYILGVVNFSPRQIGKHMSETLTLGVPDGDGECFLITPATQKQGERVPLGGKLY